ncbi:MAG: NAD(P)H-hydrate epimerase, partial [Gammaproteobacteria bacterium]
MRHLYDTRAVREMEKAAFAREDSFAVMRRAGNAVAGHAVQMIRGDCRPILILAGPGNNGGDAFVAATKLRAAGREIRAVFIGDEDKLPPDARRAFAEFRGGGGEVLRDIPAADTGYALAIDGLFGIGLSRPTDGAAAEMIRRIRGMKTLS